MIQFVSLFTWWVKDEKKREWLNQFLGFAIVGVTMTLFTIFLYFICFDIFDLPLKITYVGVYAGTVYISYLLNNKLVFRQDHSHLKLLLYYAVYLSGMLIGLVILHVFEQTLPFKKTVLSIMTIPITMVWNFILSALVLKSKKLSTSNKNAEC